ncbi:hypothetical protein Q1695_015848 [Nippostrongylus brasiliensis]|nr:hypothetical protein Q1695_015848 [Nippostrongylus brasiliensis]
MGIGEMSQVSGRAIAVISRLISADSNRVDQPEQQQQQDNEEAKELCLRSSDGEEGGRWEEGDRGDRGRTGAGRQLPIGPTCAGWPK